MTAENKDRRWVDIKYRAAAKVTMAPEDVGPWFEEEVSLRPGLLGYELVAGLCIAYASPEVCARGVEAGIIEPIAEPLPERRCRDIRSQKGIEALGRLSHALESCSLPRLKRRLERVNAGAKALTVQVWADEWKSKEEARRVLMEEIAVDLEAMEVRSYTSHLPEDWFLPAPVFRGVKDYADFLERMADLQSVDCMNSGDLYELFRESDFYSQDRFDQKFYHLRFQFTPLEKAPSDPTMPPEEARRADEEDREICRRLHRLLDALERDPSAAPFCPAAEEAAQAQALRRDRETFLAACPDHHPWSLSDRGCLDYAALARRYVEQLMVCNRAVMEDVIENGGLFARMGDCIVELAASVLWLLGPGQCGDEALWDKAKEMASEALIGCYIIRSTAPRATRFNLFRHWKQIDLPGREELESEWLALLEFTEETALQALPGQDDPPPPDNPGVRDSDFGPRFAADHTYQTILKDPGPDRVGVLKLLREFTGCSPAQAKERIAALPAVVYDGDDPDKADALRERLLAVGAAAEVAERDHPGEA